MGKDDVANDKSNFPSVVEWDYQRLLRLEQQGLDEMAKMRAAPKMTPEAVVAFINQLSPWNLNTTGVAVLEAYAEEVRSANPTSKENRA